jgi:UrcA family protein
LYVVQTKDASMTTPKLFSALAVATISLTSLSVGAADLADENAPTRTVKAWDLDLAKPEDAQTLYERVQRAASVVCRQEVRSVWMSTRRPEPRGWTERCVADAVDAAVRSVASPALAALHVRTRVARND